LKNLNNLQTHEKEIIATGLLAGADIENDAIFLYGKRAQSWAICNNKKREKIFQEKVKQHLPTETKSQIETWEEEQEVKEYLDYVSNKITNFESLILKDLLEPRLEVERIETKSLETKVRRFWGLHKNDITNFQRKLQRIYKEYTSEGGAIYG